MHLYHASVYASKFGKYQSVAYARLSEPGRVLYDRGMQHILESYHYMKSEHTYLPRVREDGRKFFLDSGAFSAYMLGVKIDLGAYCDFCLRNADVIIMASVLDAIGDPDGTWRNQDAMERRGVRPLPCYHYGEPTEVLDHYVANYEYITIGGMVPISNGQLEVWLNRIWEEHLTDAEGRPKCKVHGFGLTSPRLMRLYPWFSVDSSTWQAMGSNGSIVLPDGRALAVSGKAAQRKVQGQHVDNLTAPQRAAVAKLIEAEGLSLEEMSVYHSPRWAWNTWMMPKVARTAGHAETYAGKEQRLF